jgi:branched-chain amino acid transport system ATP-binding protein
MTEPVLATGQLRKKFDGLVAVDDVSLQVLPNAIHALIGPNGAGKSTLIDLITGEVAPTSGTVRLRGEDITGWRPDRIARRGVSRTFQHSNVMPEFTAFENCRLGAQSRGARITQCVRSAEAYADWNEAAASALHTVGLSARARTTAGTLSHGERRALEIAMCLATSPAVLLLDEPLAGMASDESARVVELLKRLAADHAILLVEHDMEAVFSLADQLTVMVDGVVIASGRPEAIRVDSAVQRAYLGVDIAALTVAERR